MSVVVFFAFNVEMFSMFRCISMLSYNKNCVHHSFLLYTSLNLHLFKNMWETFVIFDICHRLV